MAQTTYPPSHMENPGAIVSPQFLAPYPVDLTIVRKLVTLPHGNLAVTDINGNLMFEVRRRLLSLPHRRVLLDAAGNPILSFQRKLLSLHHRWVVLRGDSYDTKDAIFSAELSSLIQFHTSLKVFLGDNEMEDHCDFKVKGSWLDRCFTIYAGDTNTIVAKMYKKYMTLQGILLGQETFSVTVYPNVDYVFIVALVVILHEIHEEKRGRNDPVQSQNHYRYNNNKNKNNNNNNNNYNKAIQMNVVQDKQNT